MFSKHRDDGFTVVGSFTNRCACVKWLKSVGCTKELETRFEFGPYINKEFLWGFSGLNLRLNVNCLPGFTVGGF